MQLTALLLVVALLATADLTSARSAHSKRNLSHARLVRDETAAMHARAVEAVAANVDRRSTLAQTNPKAIRKVKRGANAKCRPRDSAFSASASSAVTTTSSAASSTATTSTAAAENTPGADAAATPDDAGGADYVQPSSAAAPAASSAAPAKNPDSDSKPSGNSNSNSMTPNGIKAGASGTDTLELFGSHISWFWNYGPTSGVDSHLTFMPTLWGNGQSGESQDWGRLEAFKGMDWNPQFVQGFYEPDCRPPMSSAIDPYVAAPLWNSLIAPWKHRGAYLVSPGMCKQADEDWLTPFKNTIGGDTMWDITSIHINKVDMAGAKMNIEHYWDTYGKPMMVTEFACVDDSNGFTPCTDQGQINSYINDIVDLLEGDSRIVAYSMSEGMGLGDVWPPYRDGGLTESGRTYLNAISKYH